MKTAHSRSSPRRSQWKRRGVLLGVCIATGAALFAVLPRVLPRLSLFPGDAQTPPRNPALEAKRNRSLSQALGKIDAKTIAAYVERWGKGSENAAPATRRAVWVDAEILARRHPAWRLAGELERGGVSPSDVSRPDPQLARDLASNRAFSQSGSDFGTPISRSGNAAPRVAPGLVLAERETRASLFAGSDRALEPFLRQNAARDARRARDDAFLTRRSLDDATELARRRAVAELELPALSPEVALELLNLRLELLRNLSRTPAERAATSEEIRVIEARYAALLAAQTRQQAARLQAVTIDSPNQARREALAKIERAAQETARNQAQTRRALAVESQNQWRRDLAATQPLRLALPPVRRAQNNASREADLPRSRGGDDFFETALSQAASNPALDAKGASRAERKALARSLREQARADARVWARAGATRLGARWSQTPNAPDATAQVLQIVFPKAGS